MKVYKTYQVGGHKRGTKLGVPTINLQVPPAFDYEYGIYAGRIGLASIHTNVCTWYPAAIHFGCKPTFAETDVTLEINIIDIEPQTIIQYNPKNIHFCLIKKIREILSFDTPAQLVKQIHVDISHIRSLLQGDK